MLGTLDRGLGAKWQPTFGSVNCGLTALGRRHQKRVCKIVTAHVTAVEVPHLGPGKTFTGYCLELSLHRDYVATGALTSHGQSPRVL